ncbi:MAG: helix-turn-helix transcriptional regulator [Hyphomicrobiales bacterium]
MTPFGKKIRQIRRTKNVSLKEMAEGVGVSSAYLSALEHGKRGTPTWAMVQRIIAYFNIIWDEAEELQRLAEISNPRIVVDTAGLDPKATELANRLSNDIGRVDTSVLEDMIFMLSKGVVTNHD